MRRPNLTSEGLAAYGICCIPSRFEEVEKGDQIKWSRDVDEQHPDTGRARRPGGRDVRAWVSVEQDMCFCEC